jgi:hypothetical protein
VPKLKRKTSQVPESGFSVYAGDEPRVGVYRGKIKAVRMKKSAANNYYYNALVEFANNDGSKAQYDGYPAWCMITMTDQEANQRREKSFYRAIGVSEDPEVDFNEPDAKKDAGLIRKIGSKTLTQIIGTEVLVEMRNRTDNRDGSSQIQADSLYPATAKATPPPEPDEDPDEEELEEDVDEVEEDEVEEDDVDDRRAELEAMTLPKLRKEAKELGIDAAGQKKDDLIDSIMDAEADAAEVEEDEVEPEGPVLSEYSGLTLVRLKKKVLADFPDYEANDLEGMKKDAILEMLVEDELVIDDDDDEPPF